jgi:hypothetical protein
MAGLIHRDNEGEKIMGYLSKLSNEDLTRRLKALSEELEELEEERSFVLKQTGIHLPGHVVKKFETESIALMRSIAEFKEEIEGRK